MEDAFFATVEEVVKHFGTDTSKGLSKRQVGENQSLYGKNELPPPARSSWFALIIKQFEDLLVLILLGSAFVSLILGFVEEKESYFEVFIEPSVIMLILIANAIVGVWQESSAEEAIERLKEFEARTAVVIRDGVKTEIDRSLLVPGDLVVLSVGEKIPADCRVISINSRTFQTDESMLTGESRAQFKQLNPINRPKNKKLETVDQEKKNILFSGTLVVHGRCDAIVVLTGGNTSMGKIQKNLMDQDEQKTPLGQKLDEFAEFLSKVILGICILVWVINIGHFTEHGGWFKGGIYYLKIAVALAVAAIPEGLPAVVTTCLALGTMKMAKKNAIVRSLPSVETLGCTTVICSDKTGTLTTNQMSVRRMMIVQDVCYKTKKVDISEFGVTGTTFDPRGTIHDCSNGQFRKDAEKFVCATKPALRKISQISSLCNDASLSYETVAGSLHWHITGEPTEGALKVLAEKLGPCDPGDAEKVSSMDVTESYNFVDKHWKSAYNRDYLLEFTRERKSMGVLVTERKHNHQYLLVKGAPESVLSRCSHVFCNENEQNVLPLTEEVLSRIELVYQEYASKGLRCLAMAYKDWTNEGGTLKTIEEANEDYGKIEDKMIFVGIVGMLDPPRAEVKDAIRTCNDAGIRVVVITGDNKKTAEAICHEIGIFGKNENLKGKSFEGSEFMSFSKNEQLSLIREASLFSRVMPAHKLHLVELLQSQREVCAMTGDGVNDAPALARADIGIGMGTGTEVARHSSDMILADDNFATIVAAVEEGRAIYANTKQFIRYLISSNIGEVACIFLTAALGLPESLIPVQLLWVNLVTDGLPATALGFNKPDRDIMLQPPRGRTEKIIDGWMFFRYALIGLYIGIATILGFVWWFIYYENGPQISYSQLTNFHSCGLDTAKGNLYFGENSEWSRMSWNGESLDCSLFHNPRPCTVSLSILVTIEMFNTFNALSENQSLLVNPPWSNIWVVLAVLLSMLLHCVILYFEFFRSIFATAAMNEEEWMAVLAISFPVVIFDEILKVFSRHIQARKADAKKKDA